MKFYNRYGELVELKRIQDLAFTDCSRKTVITRRAKPGRAVDVGSGGIGCQWLLVLTEAPCWGMESLLERWKQNQTDQTRRCAGFPFCQGTGLMSLCPDIDPWSSSAWKTRLYRIAEKYWVKRCRHVLDATLVVSYYNFVNRIVLSLELVSDVVKECVYAVAYA